MQTEAKTPKKISDFMLLPYYMTINTTPINFTKLETDWKTKENDL